LDNKIGRVLNDPAFIKKGGIMKSIIISIFVCVFIVTSGYSALGEEWTAEQKEVWTLVESYWEFCKQGDVKALFANYYTMDSYEWLAEEEYPLEKKEMKPKLQQWFSYDKPISYELNPINIHIVADVAIVFYSHKWKGNKLVERGRQIDTYVKHDNKWKFMGGMGCSCDNLPKCK
jgi:ketosteroid isomerase-like protein